MHSIGAVSFVFVVLLTNLANLARAKRLGQYVIGVDAGTERYVDGEVHASDLVHALD